MARPEATMNELEQAIERLAKYIDPNEIGGDEALKYGAAANQLAEARAWLSTAAQPHGGSAVASA